MKRITIILTILTALALAAPAGAAQSGTQGACGYGLSNLSQVGTTLSYTGTDGVLCRPGTGFPQWGGYHSLAILICGQVRGADQQTWYDKGNCRGTNPVGWLNNPVIANAASVTLVQLGVRGHTYRLEAVNDIDGFYGPLIYTPAWTMP